MKIREFLVYLKNKLKVVKLRKKIKKGEPIYSDDLVSLDDNSLDDVIDYLDYSEEQNERVRKMQNGKVQRRR